MNKTAGNIPPYPMNDGKFSRFFIECGTAYEEAQSRFPQKTLSDKLRAVIRVHLFLNPISLLWHPDKFKGIEVEEYGSSRRNRLEPMRLKSDIALRFSPSSILYNFVSTSIFSIALCKFVHPDSI